MSAPRYFATPQRSSPHVTLSQLCRPAVCLRLMGQRHREVTGRPDKAQTRRVDRARHRRHGRRRRAQIFAPPVQPDSTRGSSRLGDHVTSMTVKAGTVPVPIPRLRPCKLQVEAPAESLSGSVIKSQDLGHFPGSEDTLFKPGDARMPPEGLRTPTENRLSRRFVEPTWARRSRHLFSAATASRLLHLLDHLCACDGMPLTNARAHKKQGFATGERAAVATEEPGEHSQLALRGHQTPGSTV